MRTFFVSVLAGILISSSASAQAPSDTAQIQAVIEAYYDGMTRGDATVLDRVFHDDWHVKTLLGPDDDPLFVGAKKEYIEAYTGKVQPEYAKDRHITSIDIANNALAIVRIDSPSRNHTVFFTLFKIKGTWSMISKIFIAEKEARRFNLTAARE
jgi:hypothetical protein